MSPCPDSSCQVNRVKSKCFPVFYEDFFGGKNIYSKTQIITHLLKTWRIRIFWRGPSPKPVTTGVSKLGAFTPKTLLPKLTNHPIRDSGDLRFKFVVYRLQLLVIVWFVSLFWTPEHGRSWVHSPGPSNPRVQCPLSDHGTLYADYWSD